MIHLKKKLETPFAGCIMSPCIMYREKCGRPVKEPGKEHVVNNEDFGSEHTVLCPLLPAFSPWCLLYPRTEWSTIDRSEFSKWARTCSDIVCESFEVSYCNVVTNARECGRPGFRFFLSDFVGWLWWRKWNALGKGLLQAVPVRQVPFSFVFSGWDLGPDGDLSVSPGAHSQPYCAACCPGCAPGRGLCRWGRTCNVLPYLVPTGWGAGPGAPPTVSTVTVLSKQYYPSFEKKET